MDNPLLLEGKKFDIRCYVLIACSDPLLVLFHHGKLIIEKNDLILIILGYVRRSMLLYEPPSRYF